MAIDPKTRTKIEAELRLGKRPKELAEKYDISYGTISGWNKKIQEEQADADIDTLLEYDEVTLHHMAEEIKEIAPLPEAKKVEKLVDDVVGLQRLEEKTRSVSFSILNSVEAYLAVQAEPNLKELKEAATIVSTLHTALFNKNVTQVNVLNNNNIDTEKRSIFKSSLKA
jgi:hypothetical protein